MSPTHPRSSLLLVVCAAIAGAAPSGALAFSFAEHFRLGQDSYQHACYLLRENLPRLKQLDANDEESRAQRLEMACPGSEAHRDDLARVFGQAVALSGDHVGSPKELGTVDGLRAALSLTNYAKLGLENSNHFHPSGRRTWSRHHNDALQIAYTTPSGLYTRRHFEAMLRSLAFGEHFLQDAFAAGHLGFNRPSSAPVASMLYHDFYSRAGRVVANSVTYPKDPQGLAPPQGCPNDAEPGPSDAADLQHRRDFWVTYGDYHLCESYKETSRCEHKDFGSMTGFASCMCSKPCKDPAHEHGHADAHLRVHAAATASVLEVLYAFVTKKRDHPIELTHWHPRCNLPEKSDPAVVSGESPPRQPHSVRPDKERRDDIALVQKLLMLAPESQLPSAYGLDTEEERKGRTDRPCATDDHARRDFVALDAFPKRTYVAFAPVIEMRWGTGLVGNRDYGFWMPSLGFKVWYGELTVAYATPPPFREPRSWHREWSSLYLRLVGETPSVNLYRTPVSWSMLGGVLAEVCLQNCVANAPSDDRLLGLTLGPKLSLEALSAIVGLSAEPFVLWNKDAQVTFGLTLALSVAKPVIARRLIRGGGRYSGPDTD